MSQYLYLLRHAKSVPWGPGDDDFSRILSKRGRKHMGRLSAWLARHMEAPEKAICSPSARTVETLEALINCWPGLASDTDFPSELYGASSGALYDLAESGLSRCRSLLMVGHNPGFENLALGLMRPEDAQPIYKMPTGTFAALRFENGFEADAGNAVLQHWVTRKKLSGN